MVVKMKHKTYRSSSFLLKASLFIGFAITFTIVIPLLIVLSPFLLSSMVVRALSEVSDNKSKNKKNDSLDREQWSDFVNSMSKWSNER